MRVLGLAEKMGFEPTQKNAKPACSLRFYFFVLHFVLHLKIRASILPDKYALTVSCFDHLSFAQRYLLHGHFPALPYLSVHAGIPISTRYQCSIRQIA